MILTTAAPGAAIAPPPPAAAVAPAVVWLNKKKAAAYVGPRRGDAQTAPDTIRDWMKRGLRGVCLRYSLRGGIMFTTAEWIEEFFEAVREARGGQPGAAPSPSPRALNRRYTAAQERNRKAGRS